MVQEIDIGRTARLSMKQREKWADSSSGPPFTF